MTETPLDLVAATSALIAHDLASPIGAAAAAIETAEDPDTPDDFRAEALTLGAESMRRASATLRFLRGAYGPTAGSADGVADFAAAAVEAAAAKALTFNWPPDATPSPIAARLAALAIHGLCGVAHGGTAVVAPFAAGGVEISVRVSRIAPSGWSPPQTGPKAAPWRTAQHLADDARWLIVLVPTDGGVAIRLSPNAA